MHDGGSIPRCIVFCWSLLEAKEVSVSYVRLQMDSRYNSQYELHNLYV